ncbi:MAG: hypothetical protein HRT80_04400 [Henriciella sp.]|nr:hypothetical protein [Henriciella sp.]
MPRRPATYLAIASLATIPLFMAPNASAECDISQTKCAVNGGKCNIKFRNITGVSTGSGKDTSINQTAEAKIIRVKAVKQNGKKVGNALTINSSANKSLNLDKKAKKDFAKIHITSPADKAVRGITMSCEHVKAVLNGTGTCKVFYGYMKYDHSNYRLGYTCSGDRVVKPET